MSISATWSLDLENDASSVVFMADAVELVLFDHASHRVTIPAKTRVREPISSLLGADAAWLTLRLITQDAVRSMMADVVEKTLPPPGDTPAPPGLWG